jgi:RNA polymerase sigma-70 factor, ECF subfamily
VTAAQKGDKVAFGALVSVETQEGYRLSYGVLRNRIDAEDALQDAFLHAWRELPKLRDPDKWSAWFRRLLVNSAIEVDRRRRRRPTVQLLGFEPSAGGDMTTRVALRDEVERLMGCLESRDRVLIVLRYQQDLDLPAIAAAMRIPLGTAKSRLHRAMARMRDGVERPAQGVHFHKESVTDENL